MIRIIGILVATLIVATLHFGASYTSAQEVTISDLTVASGKPYIVARPLSSGQRVYIDRNFTYTSIPPRLEGIDFIQTANDDKASIRESFLTFVVDEPVTVFVLYDSRATFFPLWLSTWALQSTQVTTTDVPLRIFAKNFPQGRVTLGGNLASGAAGAGSN